MNKLTRSELRMQMLAGIITEGQYKAKLNEIEIIKPKDNAKAYGILFVDNDDEEELGNVDYMWDEDAYEDLVKSMGYEDKDIKGITGTMTGFFPAGEDEMRIFRARENNPELQPTDLTIGMYKKAIEDEFPK